MTRHIMKAATRKILSLALALAVLAVNLSVIRETKAASWVTNGPMTAVRDLQTATLLADGQVLVAGGENGSVLSSAESVRSGHRDVHGHRLADHRTRKSHGDVAAQRAGAGCRGHRQQLQRSFQRGAVRSSQRDVDGDRPADQRTLSSHGDVAAQWAGAGCGGR